MASFDFRSVNSDVLGLAFAVLMAAAQKTWRGYRERRADTWPISYGRIDRVTLDAEHKSVKFKCYYTYRVGEESFVGSFRKTFEDPEEGRAWQDALEKKQVAVRYDPEKPSRSQLRESELEPIVRSAAPVIPSHVANESGGIKVSAARLCSVVCAIGLAVTVVMIVEEYSGRTVIAPRIAFWTGWAALPMWFLGLWIGGKDKLSARTPAWMKFLGYALLYYAVISAFLYPHGLKERRAYWGEPRYQLFLYFSALECCYLRLQHKRRADQQGYGVLAGPST